MPVAGKVTEVNKLLEAPEKLSEDAENSAWLIKVQYTDAAPLGSLLDSLAYEQFLKEQAHWLHDI